MTPEPFPQVLASWHEFYSVAGQAAATMIGLLFVAASLGSAMFSANRPAGLRMFLSASVVQFGSVLAVSLIVLAPLHRASHVTTLVLACGGFGLAYYGVAWHGLIRTGMFAKLDWDDRFHYAILPVLGYLCVVFSGAILAVHADVGCVALAISSGLLLLAGIHNAWDITIWSLSRRNN